MVDTATQLAAVFFRTTDQTVDTLKKFDLDARNVLRPIQAIPDITPEQLKMAISAIPTDYWRLI